MNNAVAFAQDIIDMYDELKFLRARVARLEDFERKYNELLDQGLRHGEQMMGGWLNLLMKPGIAEALTAAGDQR